jgi:hypothetical protein
MTLPARISRLFVAAATLSLLAASGSAQTLEFVFPANDEAVTGDNVLVWVRDAEALSTSGSPPDVVFEFSLDGSAFELLPRHDAPDLGPGSYTTGLDTTAFPPGPLLLRARAAGQSTGPTLRLMVNRMPSGACSARSTGQGGRLVTFDCSASGDVDGAIERFDWTFGDGSVATTANPTVTHLYPNFGEFFFEVGLTDDQGFTTTLLKRVFFLIEADRLSVVGPSPNRVPRGASARIGAQVLYGSNAKPLAQVVFTRRTGALQFTSGVVSDDGNSTRVITDASGKASVSLVTRASGPALVQVTVTGTTLSAYSYFFGL